MLKVFGLLPSICGCGVQGGAAVSQRSAWGADFGASGAGAAAGEDLGGNRSGAASSP